MSGHKAHVVVVDRPVAETTKRTDGGRGVHVNYSGDWGTPQEWCAFVSAVTGGIDTDPCTAPHHLPRLKPEVAYFDRGLERPWYGTVYANVDGGNSIRLVRPWWLAGMRHLAADPGNGLVWCLFTQEHLRTLDPSPLDLPGVLVLPKARVGFHRGDGPVAKSPRNWPLWWFSDSSIESWVDPPAESFVIETGRGLPERLRPTSPNRVYVQS